MLVARDGFSDGGDRSVMFVPKEELMDAASTVASEDVPGAERKSGANGWTKVKPR